VTDLRKNFAYSTIAVAPSPATSGTSLTVKAGEGTLFATPPFNAVVWPSNSNPTVYNAEVIRVGAVSTDTLTIARSQEGSTAQPIGVGYQIMAGLTNKTLTDIETILTTDNNWLTGATSGATLSAPTIADLTNMAHSHQNTTGGSILAAPGITSFANALHTHQNAAGGGQLAYAALLSTIFSSQISTYTNTGSGAGTFYYLNFGGIKLLWGNSTAQLVNTNLTFSFIMPVSFFSSIQAITATSQQTTAVSYAYVGSYSTTSINAVVQTGSSVSTAVFLWVIGT
jgi:hypothetical protein